MKRSNFFLIVIGLLFIFSCKQTETPPKESISDVETWNLEKKGDMWNAEDIDLDLVPHEFLVFTNK